MACANVAQNLHVLAIDKDILKHTIRNEDGSWTKWIDVREQTPYNWEIDSVACTYLNNKLHVLASDYNGNLWRTICDDRGRNWAAFSK